MKKAAFIQAIDHAAIEAAISRAEASTSGEIRVMVVRQPVTDALAAAQAAFAKLGMAKTRERNALLLFIAPESQAFAVIGDSGVHEKCGQPFWDELAAAMSGHFQRAEFTAGLLAGIERAGALLAQHFPLQPGDVNELPNQVIEQ